MPSTTIKNIMTAVSSSTNNNERPATAPSNMSLQRSDSAKQFAEEHWNRAASVLSARPSLMTRDVLILALKSNPPSHVIQFMLSINPRAADVPKEGPSPLQVAVRHNASVQVIRLLIQACPLALVSTHSGYDPLMYAKIWRREEPELLALLNRPISYWVEQEKSRKLVEDSNIASDSFIGPNARTTTTSTGTMTTTSPTTTTTSPPNNKAKTSPRPSPSYTAYTNDEEMNNIKTIAATIVRAQKKQVKTLQQYRQDVESSLQSSNDKNHQERLQQLEELEKLQQRHFKSQLIALDMKEKRIMARVKKMEKRVHRTLELSKQVRQAHERRQDVSLEKMERNVQSVRGTLDAFSERTTKKVEMLEMRLEQESRVNDYFRTDTRLQLDQLDFRASALQGWTHAAENDEMTPVVYATPYVVEDDDDEEYDLAVPLCPKPIHQQQHSNHQDRRRNKRSYPKRKRSKRNLLGPLNF